MATVTQRRRRTRPKQIFPDQEALKAFLRKLERTIQGYGVSEKDARWLIKFLRERFGQGLRSELEEIRSRRVSAK